MNETHLDVTTGSEAESKVEAIFKAVSITLPIAFQLFSLFRKPKAAAATVAVAPKPLASGTIGAASGQDVAQ